MPRMTDWIDTVLALSIPTGGQANLSLITGAAPINMRGVTLIRTIINLNIISETTAGAWGIQQLDMAIGITSQEAFAAGTLPDPVTSGDKPSRGWIWRDSVGVSQNGVAGGVLVRVQQDIRGARKIENGELFIVCNSTARQGTTFQSQLFGVIRCLMKLP